jgi:hypothetical protein
MLVRYNMEDENLEAQRELDKLRLSIAKLDDFNLSLYRVYNEAKRLRTMKDRPPELDRLLQAVSMTEQFIKGD